MSGVEKGLQEKGVRMHLDRTCLRNLILSPYDSGKENIKFSTSINAPNIIPILIAGIGDRFANFKV